MKEPIICLLSFCLTCLSVIGAEPTEFREWNAKSGHKVEAKALQIAEDKVQLERANGSKVLVPLDKLSEEDQSALREHFGTGKPDAENSPPANSPEGTPADDLPHPLGTTTEEISCGNEYSYFLYLPKSLQKGGKHPVLFVTDPSGGSKRTVRRYQTGAERNRWIIAVSKQSKNSFEGSADAVDSMIKHVTSELSIDKDRMYTTGFSGGSREAFCTAQRHKEIAGVLACGAGGNVGSSKQVVYGLCGSNCFNRTDMANSFKRFKNRDCVLRYFPGKHAWGNEELCDDGITHLNGVFLAKHRTDYPDDYSHYVGQVSALIEQVKEAAPMRAYMWTSFLSDHRMDAPNLTATHSALGADPMNKLYVKGLADVSKFAQKNFGTISNSQWQSDPKVSAACMGEAKKYVGTPWEEVLKLMSEDAQKF